MAKPLVQFLSETSGFCCQWAFLTQPKYVKMTNKELAETLGIGLRTVVETRSMLKDGAFACRKKDNCRHMSTTDTTANVHNQS